MPDQATEGEYMDADPITPVADPPSPAKAADKPPSPTKVADDHSDDVLVTGVDHTTPGNPVALSKHSAKEEFSTMDKGKWKIDLSSYAHLNAQEIHSGFLNRLFTSRDYEAGLVNLMKERYEVNIESFTLYLHCIVAPKGRFAFRKLNRDFAYFRLYFVDFSCVCLIKHTLAPKCHD